MAFSDELRAAADELWEAQHAHPFVRGIGDGSLAHERFAHYVRQDFLFLLDYGRLFGVACARAPRADWSLRFAELAVETLREELALHRAYAARWGIGEAELQAEPRGHATGAYVDFLLRTAALGDFGALVAALLPCMWGYSEVGRRLADAGAPAEPRYAEWIATYADPGFAALAAWCREVVDAVAPTSDRDAMRAAFLECSRHELAFWQQSWEAAG